MPSRFVPITLGAPEHLSLSLRGFDVTNAKFPPGDVIEPHEHVHATIATMLDGSFDLRIRGRTFTCDPHTVFTEPAGERHSNHMQRAGAHVLVVEVHPEARDWPQPFRELVETVHYKPHAAAASHARAIAREMASPDAVTPLAVEALVLEFLAGLARSVPPCETHPPIWLGRAEELLHARFREDVTVRTLADEVDVHPVHVMRVFRAHYGTSVGTYVRRLRLDWAAGRLVTTTDPIAAIALAAGFADQSHFTRLFRARTGRTPARYRADARDGR